MNLTIENLWISLEPAPGKELIRGLSFELEQGSILGLLGPSGSGKTITALSILGLAPEGRKSIRRGSIRLGERELTSLDESEYRKVRGGEIAMVFQDPGAALTPVHPIGDLLAETIRAHRGSASEDVEQRVRDLLAEVGFKDPSTTAGQFPYELSGGMRQRAMIALALAGEPSVLIADEPTSALDPIAQDEILSLIESVRERRGVSILLITHDAYVTRRMADRAIELKEGRGVPVKPDSRPTRVVGPPTASETPFEEDRDPILKLNRLSAGYPPARGRLMGGENGRTENHAVIADVSFEIKPGETLGLVGPSGCGKTTVARSILRLVDPISGDILLDGQEITVLGQRHLRPLRRQMGAVFQNPALSLNPKHSAGRILEAPLAAQGIGDRSARKRRVTEAIESVDLGSDLLVRRPQEMSGGQQQRLALARALISEPRVLICDEPFTALDRPLRDQLTDLLVDLQARRQLACLFIAHDLETIVRVADRIAVMDQGRITQIGVTRTVLGDPSNPFTRALVTSGGFTGIEL